MRFLRRMWIRVWYWRHRLVTLRHHRFIGGARGEFWCMHCGGEAVGENIGGRPRVISSTCVAGRAWMRLP